MTVTAGSARGAPPDVDDVGVTATWDLPVDDGADVLTVRARFIGYADSRRSPHASRDFHVTNDPDVVVRDQRGAEHRVVDGVAYAVPGARCGSCRWFEARIFRVDQPGHEHDGDFIIHYTGATVVPGEVDRSRLAYADGGHALVEQATSRNIDAGRVFITPPMARALAMAANHDPDVEHAWVNRAVE